VALLALVVLEGASSLAVALWQARLHVWRPLAERSHTVYDAELGWVAEKNKLARNLYGPGLDLSTNAQGFRNKTDFAKGVPAGKRRVVCLGDSFTLGYGVADESAWPARLQQDCPSLEVVNMGQAGYGIDQSFLWYERDGAQIDHQVLVFAFISDDFERARSSEMLGYGKPVLEASHGELVRRNVPVPRASYVAPLVTQNLRLLRYLRTAELLERILAAARPGVGQPAQVGEDETGRAAELILRTTHEIARARGAALVFVHLPSVSDAGPAELAALPKYARAAIDAARGSDVPFIDLRAVFAAIPQLERGTLFLPETGSGGAGRHYSNAGNQLVARALASRLGALGFISASECPASAADSDSGAQ